jgi:hypothetical protein
MIRRLLCSLPHKSDVHTAIPRGMQNDCLSLDGVVVESGLSERWYLRAFSF